MGAKTSESTTNWASHVLPPLRKGTVRSMYLTHEGETISYCASLHISEADKVATAMKTADRTLKQNKDDVAKDITVGAKFWGDRETIAFEIIGHLTNRSEDRVAKIKTAVNEVASKISEEL